MRLTREGFALELDPERGRGWLRARGGLTLRLDPPQAAALGPRGPALRSRGRVKSAAGAAERIELQWQLGADLGLRWVLELPEDGGGLVAELALEPRGAAAAPEGPLVPLRLEAPGPPHLCARRLALGDPEEALWLLEPDEPSRPHLLLGLVGGPRRGGVEALAGAEGALQLRAVDPGRTGPGSAARASARALLALGPDAARLQAAWARRAGVELGARAPARGGVAWPGARPSPALPGLAPVALTRVPDDEPVDAGADPSVGADAWRLGVGGAWRRRIGRVDALRVERPQAQAFANRRLWLNAVGPVDAAALPMERLRSALSIAGLGAGLVELAAVPDDLPAARRALLRRSLPPLAREVERCDDETLLVRLLGERRALLLHNPGTAPRRRSVAFAALGLSGPQHAFDFWAERDLGVHERGLPPCTLPPGGCRVLGLSPPLDRPQVIGSSLHLGLGTLEVAALRREGGTLRLVLRHPGEHEGAVWVAVPGEPHARRTRVTFRDEAEVGVPAAGPG